MSSRPLNEHPTYRRTPSLGESRVKFVTKTGEEGLLALDEGTGQLLTKLTEMPDWADKLATAGLAERQKFYIDRLGKESPECIAHLSADTINFDDLMWFAVDDEGKTVEIEASGEFRLGVVTDMLEKAGVIVNGQINQTSGYIYEGALDADTAPISAAEAEATTAEMAGALAEHDAEQAQKKAAQG